MRDHRNDNFNIIQDEWDVREARLAEKFTIYHNNLIHKKMKSLFAPADNNQRRQSEPVPSGMHHAICYSIIDLGTQPVQWEGQTLMKRKVRFTFELPNELRTFNEEKGPQPMVISREFTLSMHEKSVLRPFVEGWLGQKFANDIAAAQFNIFSLIGVNGLGNIIHTKKGDATYANLQAVTPLMKGMSELIAVNPLVEFETFEWDWDTFNNFPQFLQEKLKQTPEWDAAQARLASQPQKKVQPIKPQETSEEDDLPF